MYEDVREDWELCFGCIKRNTGNLINSSSNEEGSWSQYCWFMPIKVPKPKQTNNTVGLSSMCLFVMP